MKRFLSVWLTALLLWSMLSVPALAVPGEGTPAAEAPKLHLHSGAVDPAGLPARPELQSLAPGQSRLYIVQFNGVITDESWSALADAGVEVGPYLPDFAFVIHATPNQAQALSRHSLVRAVTRFRPEWKISPRLQAAGSEADVAVVGFPGQGAALGAAIAAASPKAENSKVGAVLKGLARNRLQSLAESEAILFLDLVPERELLNQAARGIMKVDTAGGPWDLGLTGSGQIVAVADTGLDTGSVGTLHPDFAGRLVGASSWGRWSTDDWSDPHGHGTHVAGSVLGDGSASAGAYAGVAPEAQLFFQSLLTSGGGLAVPYDLSYLFDEAQAAGARIHTNSWGGGTAYDDFSAMVDEHIWANKGFAILFAAGNYGEDRSVASPGNAKNAITVGASENNFPDDPWGDNPNEVAAFSSRGPTPDGRIKPDVVAPGTWVLSARSSLAPSGNFWDGYDSRYAYMGGTSMSTPLTAGAAALVRQHLQEAEAIANPSASLIKALLINGARDMGYGWGTAAQGWGRVDLANTLDPEGSRTVRFEEEGPALATSASRTYTYDVREGDILKITLVWSDRDGTPLGSKNLVNDLDLTVTGPDGKVYKGNCFNSARTTASTACSSYDRVNNVENVYIAAPATGTYTVRVKGYNVPKGPQPYSLVASGNLTDLSAPVVQLTAPAPNAIVTGQVTITAEASDNQGVAWVEFYVNETMIGGDDDPSDGWSYTWDSTGASGKVNLRAEAHDADSNVGVSAVVSVIVDNGPPGVAIASPADGAFVRGTVSVAVNAADAQGIAQVEFHVGGEVRHTDTTAPYAWVWDTAKTADGPYSVTARAHDRASQTADATISFTVDNTPPALALNLAAGSAVPAGSIPLTATATDGNGVTRVEFFVGATKIGTDTDGEDGFTATWNTAGIRSMVYQVKAVAYDAAGNSQTVTVPVTVDAALPALTPTSPAPGAWLTGTVNVTGKVTDNVGVAKVEVYLGEELAATLTPPSPTRSYAYLWPWATEGDGPRALLIKAYDNAGNVTTRTIDVSVDHTPPAVSLSSPAPGGLVPTAAVVTAEATDNVQVARVEFYLDGKLVTTDTAAPYEWKWSTSKLADGSAHTLQARAYDAVGLSTPSDPVNVVVDNVAPAPFSLQAGSSALRDTATITAAVGEGDGVVQVKFLMDGALVQTDTEAPFTVAVDTTTLSDGKHKLEALAYDAAGNTRTASLAVTIDNAAPTFTASGLTEGQRLRGNATIKLSARDNLGLAQIVVYLDGDPETALVSKAIRGTKASQSVVLNSAAAADGPHTLHVRLVDGAGNTTDTTYNIIVDNTAPTVAISGPADGAKLPAGSHTVSATAGDDHGVDRVEFWAGKTKIGTDTDGSDGWSVSWNISSKTRSAAYTLKAVAYDQAGNSASATIGVEVDTVGPTVSITSPSTNAVVSGSGLSAGAKITDKQGITRVELLVDGDKLDDLTLDPPLTSYTYSTTWDSTAVASGPRSVTMRATDTFGNVTEKTVTVKVDNEGPTATLTAPASGGYVGTSTVVSASLSDVGGGIKKIEVLVDDVVKSATTLRAPATSHSFKWTWSTKGLAAGTVHTVTIRVTDAAGNVDIDSATVTVDTAAPTATLESPGAGGYLTGTVDVEVRAADNIGVARAEIYLGSAKIGTVSGSDSPDEVLTYSWNTAAAKDGSQSLKVVVYDLAGNSVTRSASVKVDNGLPTLRIDNPKAGAALRGSLTVKATASDGSGVAKVEFYLDDELMATDTRASYTWSWNTTTAANGPHTITVMAHDKAGNTRSGSVAVTVSN